ncbi:hypothetical protein TKK_0010363 [Trichogramma kaykai]|uniref:Uncharacterized protein n=1 Tax=Trichogramma kaykai TaxID=54128 RepID=A0ABD2WWX5_9HYME
MVVQPNDNVEQNPTNNDVNNIPDDPEAMEEEAMDDVDVEEPEFEVLNAQLDQLAAALDSIESKNDNLYVELKELLETSRQARCQFQAAQESQTKETS